MPPLNLHFIAALVAAFLLAGCTDRQAADIFYPANRAAEAPPTKPKTAYLLNGLGVYGKPGMMGPIKQALERRGYTVTVLNHVQGKYLTQMPDVLIGHSMGANAALKRSQAFRKNPPKLIVAIDAGRAPLWWKAPNTKAKTVSIYCPRHPIGGQYVYGAENIEVCGTDHLYMPHDPRVIKIILEKLP